ncbi:MAG: hypothetical protein IJZ34_10985 [Lachnospiraceae bacterium]|nr:hypothetical protein [Lachnospiraceae bacterium]
MDNLGGLGNEMENAAEEKVVDMNDVKKRRAFHYWEVAGRTYRMKLKASTIGKLENKYRKNIMNLIDEMPPLSVMLTIIQAAMEPWEHGIEYTDVQKIYDKWTEEGGNQMDLFKNVIIPVMAVSGFFTEKQAATILENLEEL